MVKTEESGGSNFYAPDSRPWWRRALSKLFPARAVPEFPDDLGGAAPGHLCTEVDVRLDWLDRLRVLVSGRLRVVTHTQTDVLVFQSRAASAVWVDPPFGGSP